MRKPTLLELALKEWGVARDALIDMYTAVYLKRSFDRAFVGAVRKSYDVDLDLPRPYHVHSIACVLRETKVFVFLKNHVEDPSVWRGFCCGITTKTLPSALLLKADARQTADDYIFGDPIDAIAELCSLSNLQVYNILQENA